MPDKIIGETPITVNTVSFECLRVFFNIIHSRQHPRILMECEVRKGHVRISDTDMEMALDINFYCLKSLFPLSLMEVFEEQNVIGVVACAVERDGIQIEYSVKFDWIAGTLDEVSERSIRPAMAQLADLVSNG